MREWFGLEWILNTIQVPPVKGVTSSTWPGSWNMYLKYVSELTVPVELDLTCRICFPSVQVPEHSVGIFPHQSLDRWAETGGKLGGSTEVCWGEIDVPAETKLKPSELYGIWDSPMGLICHLRPTGNPWFSAGVLGMEENSNRSLCLSSWPGPSPPAGLQKQPDWQEHSAQDESHILSGDVKAFPHNLVLHQQTPIHGSQEFSWLLRASNECDIKMFSPFLPGPGQPVSHPRWVLGCPG